VEPRKGRLGARVRILSTCNRASAIWASLGPCGIPPTGDGDGELGNVPRPASPEGDEI
jgi:hypothetical protein